MILFSIPLKEILLSLFLLGFISIGFSQPINDDKINAIELTNLDNWCSQPAQFSNELATSDGTQPPCWSEGPNYNVWFKFQAPASGIVSVELKTGGAEGTIQHPMMAIWDNAQNVLNCSNQQGQYENLTLTTNNLSPGQWYFISVDNHAPSFRTGSFTLCLNNSGSSNDTPQTAIELSDLNNWCSQPAQFSNELATSDGIQPSCWPEGPNYNVWFKFQAPASGIVSVELKTGGTEGTIQHPMMAIWDDAQNVLNCTNQQGQYENLTLTTNNLSPGQWYFISVDNHAPTARSGSFSLCLNDGNSNYDSPGTAFEITDLDNWCSQPAQFSNELATSDGTQPPCWSEGPNYNVWFKFQAPASGIVSVELKTGGAEGTIQHPMMAIWDNAQNVLNCSNQQGQYENLTLTTNNLSPGQWYFISVDNHAPSFRTGSFTLCLNNSGSSNDTPQTAIELSDLNNWCSQPAQFSNELATSDGIQPSCWPEGPNYNVWFKFQAPASGIVSVELKTGGTEGTIQHPMMAIWDDAQNVLNCTNQQGQYENLTLTTNNLSPGQWYFISVDNHAPTARSGSFSLCLNDGNSNYDSPGTAFEITDLDNWCSQPAQFSNELATSDGTQPPCWSEGPNYNVWFKFQAPASGIVSVELKTGGAEGTIQHPMMAIWDNAQNVLNCSNQQGQYENLTLTTNNLSPGQWYFISVDNHAPSFRTGSFTLCLNNSGSSNDTPQTAIELSDLNNWCSQPAQFSNELATSDGIQPSCWPEGPNYNVWFKFQAPASGIVSVELKTGGTEGNIQYPMMALWDDADNVIECLNQSSQYDNKVINASNLNSGEWYYISVDNTIPESRAGTFTLCLNDESSSNNDNKENAYLIDDIENYCSSLGEYTNEAATGDEPKPSCWTSGPYHNVWFKFVATPTGMADISLKTGGDEGTMVSPNLALWDASGNVIDCRNQNDGEDISIEQDALIPGDTYFISVDNYINQGGKSGTFTLCIQDHDLGYNIKSGAHLISDITDYCSGLGEFSNIGTSGDEPKPSCWTSGPYHNVWFKFVATPTGMADISLKTGGDEGTMVSPNLALWDASGNVIDCRNQNDGEDISIEQDALIPGDTYFISVDNYINQGGKSGTFTLCIQDHDLGYNIKSGAHLISDITDYCSGLGEFSNIGTSGDEPKPSCWTSGPYHNVWFKFVATPTGMADISLKTGGDEGTMVSPNLALWDASGNVIDCRNQNDGEDISIEQDALIPGDTYFISVDNYINQGGKSGTFTLCINEGTQSSLSFNFQELTPADFRLTALGIDDIEGRSGDAGETITFSPTAPTEGNTNNVSIHVLENSNPATNNAGMVLKVVYNHELNIEGVKLVAGTNEQDLSPSFYEIVDGKNLVFKGEEEKKALFPITTNLQGVLYNELDANFTVTLADANLFSTKKLRVLKDGVLQGNEITTHPFQWVPSGNPEEGVYHFELDLEPVVTGTLQTFKGQFIVK